MPLAALLQVVWTFKEVPANSALMAVLSGISRVRQLALLLSYLVASSHALGADGIFCLFSFIVCPSLLPFLFSFCSSLPSLTFAPSFSEFQDLELLYPAFPGYN